MPFKKGHKRIIGAGIKKGDKQKKTILREQALKDFQQSVVNDLRDLYFAGRKSATGLMVMYQRKLIKNAKTGKYERTGELLRVTDPDKIQTLLNSEGEGSDWYYISAKDPNIQALNSLMDRTFGKPKESIEVTGEEGGPIQIEISLREKIKKIYGDSSR